MARDLALEKGLPSAVDSEQLILGSILLDDSTFVAVAGAIEVDDFVLEKHRLIFQRMREISDRGERIDRVTVANELMKHGQLEKCDGLTYLVSLDDGLPRIYNLDSYIQIVRQKSLLRRTIFTCQKIMDRALLAQEEPSAILADAEESLLRLGDTAQRATLANPGQIIEEFEGGLSAFLDPSRRLRGTSTGYLKLDELTGGFREGELIILAARPGMGKTALGLNIAQHVAMNQKARQTVAVFSLEMSKASLLDRMVCATARVDQHKFRAGYLNADERRRLSIAAQDLVEAPLYIDDTAGASIMDIHAKLRRLKAEHGLGLVMVDYLQLMNARGRYDSRTQEVSAISRGLKLLSKELRVPMLVLSQLNRNPETRGDNIPQLSDLRESGAIEQDADLVLFIYRPEVYHREREDLKGVAEIIIAKQRNGPTERFKLAFLSQYTKFENMAGDLDTEPAT
jgi:replicative DNA helicase